MTTASAEPLSGIRILEIANIIAGPTAGQILGDFGAEIIKIEHPEDGDGSRRQAPQKHDKGLWWKMIGRNKKSVGMYLGDPEAAAIFLEMVKSADVVIESFRSGVIEKWGLGYDKLKEANPRIILARLTGYGQTGPYAKRAAFGSNIEAMSGMPMLTGDPSTPPTMPVYALCDYIAGSCLATAIVTALFERTRSGEGQVIDASLLQPMITAMTRPIMNHDQLGIREVRNGNRVPTGAPRNIYLTKDDKWVAVSAATADMAGRVMALVGKPEIAREPWFRTGSGRYTHSDEIDGAVADWMAARDRDEIMAIAKAESVTFGPLYEIKELVEDEHVVANEMLATVEDPDFGPMKMPNVLFRLSRTPGSIKWTGQDLGASTDEVLTEFGIGGERLAALRERGVVR